MIFSLMNLVYFLSVLRMVRGASFSTFSIAFQTQGNEERVHSDGSIYFNSDGAQYISAQDNSYYVIL